MERWVAIDDTPLGLDPAHFVQTDGNIGLTETQAVDVIAMLTS